MEIDYEKVPVHMREATRGYIEEGHKYIGHFLPALFSNNLVETYGKADDINKAALSAWLDFLHWEAPAPCWGSKEKVAKWQESGGLNGLLFPTKKEGAEKVTDARIPTDAERLADALTDEQVRVLTYTYGDICCLADTETDGVSRQLCCEHAETKRALGEAFPWLLQAPGSI